MADHADCLIEVGTEELPPKALPALSRAFVDGMASGLDEAGLARGAVRGFASPRRLAVLIENLAVRQPDRKIERRGPPLKVAFDSDGQPTRAAEAFARNNGVEVAALQTLSTDKGEWLVHRATESGRDARTVVQEVAARALDALPAPKRMRWGSGDAEFVRPVHWVLALHGREILDIELIGLRAGRSTRGHRFHAPEAIDIPEPSQYQLLLENPGYVIADFAKRRERIRTFVEDAAKGGHEAMIEDALLDEVTALVEWPVVVTGKFPARFLELPPEVLIETLQAHQRYFPVRDESGALVARFVAVSNVASRDPAQVRAGNERVVLPRLADAAFFWESDSKIRLAERVEQLDRVVFQKKLGTLGDKARRVAALAERLAPDCGAEPAQVARAARLAKTDLLTDMVGEFPELQGVMGRHYAERDGEAAEVAWAMEEQYRPRYAGDALPRTAVGRTLAIADRIDTIAGIFAIGGRPSGSKDPFALRRSAIGVLRILIECELDVDITAAIREALAALPFSVDHAALADEIYQFVTERLRAYYQEVSGATFDASAFEAVLARRPDRPLDFDRRLRAVQRFMRLDAAESLAAANKRIANILRQADGELSDDVVAERLAEPAERRLHEQLESLRPRVTRLLGERRYTEALERLAELREAVDRFFDDVMVMSEDDALRANRLALLHALHALFSETADLSRLQPQVSES